VTRYAFLNADSIVVQATTGDLSDDLVNVFMRDYAILFSATSFVRVEDDRPVWIGGSYDSDSGAFAPPPTPEPEVIVTEAVEVIADETVEVIEEILPE
jgi:hypothetical protein